MESSPVTPDNSHNGTVTIQSPAPALQRTSRLVTLVRGGAFAATLAALTGLFLLMLFLVLRADLQPTSWDVSVTHEIQEFPSSIGWVLVQVSQPGFFPFNWIIAGAVVLFMLLRRWITEAIFTLFAGLGGLTAEGIKFLVDRPRPTPDFAHIVTVLNSYSFPSGHVTWYTTFFGFLFYLSYTSLPHRSLLRWPLVIFFGLMVILIGPSRVYMGQHWASDAIAGYALGFAYLLILVQVHRWWLRRHPVASEQ